VTDSTTNDDTRLSTGTSVVQLSPHHGPSVGLGVDGGGRSGRRPRRSGQSGPPPGSPAVRLPTSHTNRKPPRGALGNHGQQPHHSRGHRSSPNSNTGPNHQGHARRRLRRGGVRGVGRKQPIWTRPPGNTTSPARVLVLEVRRPRPLPRRLPDPCGALLLATETALARNPRPPPSREPPAPHAGTPRTLRNVQRSQSEHRAHCAATAGDNAAVTVVSAGQMATPDFPLPAAHLSKNSFSSNSICVPRCLSFRFFYSICVPRFVKFPFFHLNICLVFIKDSPFL
jgi:hypothetical protein